MKKTIIILSAMASMMTACNNDETLDVVARQPITFTDAFVENSSRAAIDGSYSEVGNGDGKLSKFQVYGTISNGKTGNDNVTANIFDGTEVKYTTTPTGSTGESTSYWEYTNTQYWIPGNTYNFTAIADGNVTENNTKVTEVVVDESTGMPATIKLNDASKQKDILYAKAAEVSNVDEGYSEDVSFTFNHLLAKAKFTVKNTITNTNYAYKVSDVKITNAVKSATYTISENPTWSATQTTGESEATTYELGFGNIVGNASNEDAEASYIIYSEDDNNPGLESNYERLLIPGTYSETNLTISFKTELYVKDLASKETDQFKKFQTKETVTVQPETEVTLQPGHAYNFVIELGAPGNEIKFNVTEITAWDEDPNDDASTEDSEVSTEEKTN